MKKYFSLFLFLVTLSISAQNYTKQFISNSSSELTLNCSTTNAFEILLGSNVTISLSNITGAKGIRLWLVQDGTGNRVVHYSNQFTFPGLFKDSTKLTANSITVVEFQINDGKIYCTYNSNLSPGATAQSISDSILANTTQYLYKTVYVDSAKIWNQFDTLIIVAAGINNTIVLDEIRYHPVNGNRMYDKMACFMTYFDTITGQVEFDILESQLLANGNGSSHTLGSGNLGHTGIVPGTLSITTDAQTLTDNGDNTLSGDGTGTINYNTGDITLNWTSAPINGHPINADTYGYYISGYLRTSFSEIGLYLNYGNGSIFSTPKLIRPLMSEPVAILNGSWLLTWNNVANDYFTTSLFLNKGVKFHAGDFINSENAGYIHNSIGNLKLKFTIKYHIETIE